MVRLFLSGSLFLFVVTFGQAQMKYSIKGELGYLNFQTNTVQIDPGPDWKGYYLEDQNGIDLKIINGIAFNENLFIGLGLGYLNFEGLNGISLFGDMEYLPLKTKLTPLINLKVGRSHLWNQYENGTSTALGEFGLGLNYRLKGKTNLFIKSGLLFTQQSQLIPIRFGVRL